MAHLDFPRFLRQITSAELRVYFGASRGGGVNGWPETIGVERVPGGREGIDVGTLEGPDWDDCIDSSGSGDKGVGDEKGDHGRSCSEHGNGSGRVAGSRRYPSVSS